jgi:uracil-DNA glycosylase
MLEKLNALERTYKKCTKCSELVANRKNVVFGTGIKNPKVVIIGEAPGANEDLKNEPFVGRSGKILDFYLNSIGLSRTEDAYITNTILCRPPKNRNPSSIELSNCRLRLEAQLKILSPKVIVTLGNFATKYILKTKEGITCLRGIPKEISHLGFPVKVLPMQHPAVLLYNGNSPEKKAEFEHDFNVLKELLLTP